MTRITETDGTPYFDTLLVLHIICYLFVCKAALQCDEYAITEWN